MPSQSRRRNPGLLETEILPKVVDLPPDRWIPTARDLMADLSRSQKHELLREGVEILRKRRRVFQAIEDSVKDVQEIRFDKGLTGDQFKGVLLFGSVTGKSQGVLMPVKALDVHKVTDIDFIPFFTVENPDLQKFVKGELSKSIQRATGLNPSPYGRILAASPRKVESQLEFIQNCCGMKHLRPESWHFIGDEDTRKILDEALKNRRKEK
jgi:hypothetical protein